MNNLLYKLTLHKGEPEQEMVYAYLSDDTVKLIEEELSGTKTTNVEHTFIDVASKEYDIGIVDDISCVKDNEYDKWESEEVSFGLIYSAPNKALADYVYDKLIKTGEEVHYDKMSHTLKLYGIDYPRALILMNETKLQVSSLDKTLYESDRTILCVSVETYQEVTIGTINAKDDVWKLQPVPNIKELEGEIDISFIHRTMLKDNFHNTIDKFALLETAVNMKTKHYLDDFYNFDVQILSYPKEDKYLWIVRDCGTHLVPKSEVSSHPVVEYYMSQDKNKDCLYYEIDTNEKSLNMGMLNPVLINDINKYINDCKQEAQEKALLEEFMSDIDYGY